MGLRTASPRLTGRQHIDWFARSRGGVDDCFVRRLLEWFAVVADGPVRELSKGNRQKIGLVLGFGQVRGGERRKRPRAADSPDPPGVLASG